MMFMKTNLQRLVGVVALIMRRMDEFSWGYSEVGR